MALPALPALLAALAALASHRNPLPELACAAVPCCALPDRAPWEVAGPFGQGVPYRAGRGLAAPYFAMPAGPTLIAASAGHSHLSGTLCRAGRGGAG